MKKENGEKIFQLEAEIKELEERLKNCLAENERLSEALKSIETEFEKNKRACLSQEQTATLLQDLVTTTYLFVISIIKLPKYNMS